MPNDLQSHAPGATHFFTIRLADRTSSLLLREIDTLRRAMREVMMRFAFNIDAITVLPATVHLLATLPPGDAAYAARISMLKSRFSRAMPMSPDRTPSQIRRGEKGIWQKGHWEHQVRDAADFARHRDLIHLSPVHAGLCHRPEDWLHSSLHRDLATGRPVPAPLDHGTPGRTSRGAMHLPLTQPRLTTGPNGVLIS